MVRMATPRLLVYIVLFFACPCWDRLPQQWNHASTLPPWGGPRPTRTSVIILIEDDTSSERLFNIRESVADIDVGNAANATNARHCCRGGRQPADTGAAVRPVKPAMRASAELNGEVC